MKSRNFHQSISKLPNLGWSGINCDFILVIYAILAWTQQTYQDWILVVKDFAILKIVKLYKMENV